MAEVGGELTRSPLRAFVVEVVADKVGHNSMMWSSVSGRWGCDQRELVPKAIGLQTLGDRIAETWRFQTSNS